MPKTNAHLRSSRRAPPLKDSEIDHEISLVDHSPPIEEPRSPTSETGDNIDSPISSQPLIPSDSRAEPSTQPPESGDVQPKKRDPDEAGPSGRGDTSQAFAQDADGSVTGNGPISKKNGLKKTPSQNKNKPRPRPRPFKKVETAIDILWENQRGAFFCGIPRFSSAALGNLDPPPWTNRFHKPSMTDIHTAQVPDPSWEWAWPEWRINRDETIPTDSDGWEYSFMFSNKFSWHGPKWYNSFVRRRAWIRRRIKKRHEYHMNDPHMSSYEYFTINPARMEPGGTIINQIAARISQETFRKLRDILRDEDGAMAMVDITTTDELIFILRKCRIDREKLEAIENYIKHCTDDLQELQYHMHKIMSLFVFQTTRKLLLARLIQLHNDQVDKGQKGQKGQKGTSLATQQKAENLAAAIRHADEEVRRLEYWSDIKGMAKSGESRGAVDCGKGWDGDWTGLDNSGPRGVREDDELP
ncbi:hypothetical protein F5Y00DRAFT_225774 [Daldinia vernicosa]|uniref:uncharacterized protein n=1 Tax=Daldinia vernicosa TaxID=114800 RepID=UPI0020072617|nr:uncharacterized protein F5Y00DRAFT_225774 [Daldinia vernicosa]KAI0853217.1 hypothetical protein F5Y00DRAFT_225774 [Daldinia vernicosa]